MDDAPGGCTGSIYNVIMKKQESLEYVIKIIVA